MSKNGRKAILLLSGGLDSATSLAIAKKDGFEIYAISFLYGQRHSVELECARKLAACFSVNEHREVEIDLGSLGGSSLTTDDEIPKHNSVAELGEEIPSTYVPARNTIFLSYAIAWAEVIGAFDIFIGVNALDYSGYPDCRPEYILAFEKMANLATASGVGGNQLKIHTPLINLTKAEIIKIGLALGVDYSLTTSCYDPDPNGVACGQCDSCLLRLKGFEEADSIDPRPYKIGDRNAKHGS